VKILGCFISDFEGTTLAFDRKVPGCQLSKARHVPLAFSFIDLVCIESNLLHVFGSVVVVAFQIVFRAEIHANDVFLFFKNHF
jgi:hypothetical protein